MQSAQRTAQAQAEAEDDATFLPISKLEVNLPPFGSVLSCDCVDRVEVLIMEISRSFYLQGIIL
jgi:hypothetical protein